MTKVISFINRKGGTGKTTNAINVATAIKEMGFDVAFIETDTNYSLSQIRKQELAEGIYVDENGHLPDLVQTEESTADRLIKTFRNDMVSFVIVDGAANMNAHAINRISANSDIVVVPTGISKQEVSVTEHTLNDILSAYKDNPNLKIVLLPNRIHFLTAQETVNKILEHLHVPILEVYIPYFKQFTNISTIMPAEGYMDVANYILKLLDMGDSSIGSPVWGLAESEV